MTRNPTPYRKLISARPWLGLTAAVLVSVAVAGCATRVAVRGNLPDSERLAEVVPGDMSREEVAEILGSPSSVTPFDSHLWLYISEKTETFAFMAPKVLERNVIMVRFSEGGQEARPVLGPGYQACRADHADIRQRDHLLGSVVQQHGALQQ